MSLAGIGHHYPDGTPAKHALTHKFISQVGLISSVDPVGRNGETIMHPLNYRRDIDGLRAVSILLVLVYHLEIVLGETQLFVGGYIGVDVFFVISGFLITSILRKELEQTGKIRFRHFYVRRARRLLPALLTMIAVSSVFAWRYLLPDQLIEFATSAIWSIFFVSNFFWLFNLQEYGADSGLLMPLLHTWSLAVEEQYYFFAPAAIWGLWRLFARRLDVFFVSLSIVGFGLAVWFSKIDHMASFYLLPSRIWEISAGAALAIHMGNNPNLPALHRKVPLAEVGLLLIVLPGLFFPFNPLHPGISTLPAVLGTLFVLSGRGAGHAKTLLSSKPMVLIGLLSYSLYLWHFPVFAFGRIASPEAALSEKGIWLAITLAVSAACYVFIEKPLRFNLSPRVAGTALASGVLGCLFFAGTSIRLDGAPERMEYLNEVLQAAAIQRNIQNDAFCHGAAKSDHFRNLDVVESCVFSNGYDGSALILVGDSHAGALAWRMRDVAQSRSLDFVQVTFAGCSHLQGGYFGSQSNERCLERAEQFSQFLREFDNPIIVFSARVPVMLEQSRFDNQEGAVEVGYRPANPEKVVRELGWRTDLVVETLTDWAERSRALILIYPVPEQGFHVHRRLAAIRPLPRSVEELPILSTSLSVYRERTQTTFDAFEKVTGGTVLRIYPDRIFCSDETGRCVASDRDKIYFASDNHVSDLGAEKIASEVADALDHLSAQARSGNGNNVER